MDLSQEPTYSLITIGLPTNDDLDAAQLQYTPIDFSYKGQDLVYGGWTNANPGSQTVSVLYMTGPNIGFLGSQKLLGQMNNPRIVVPQNELIFDSMDPFFVADGSRTYLVQPEYFTVANYPQEIEVLNQYIQNWTIKYAFETFYHPYARTLLRELEVGGISKLMSRNLQTNPQSVANWPAQFNFQTLFQPEQCVATPYPGQDNAPDPGESLLDFDPGCGGAYSLYNWEVFYRGPMFVASLYAQYTSETVSQAEQLYIFADLILGPQPDQLRMPSAQQTRANVRHAPEY